MLLKAKSCQKLAALIMIKTDICIYLGDRIRHVLPFHSDCTAMMKNDKGSS